MGTRVYLYKILLYYLCLSVVLDNAWRLYSLLLFYLLAIRMYTITIFLFFLFEKLLFKPLILEAI